MFRNVSGSIGISLATALVTRPEAVPEKTLIVDLVHRAVRRIAEGEGDDEPAAIADERLLELAVGYQRIPDAVVAGGKVPLPLPGITLTEFSFWF